MRSDPCTKRKRRGGSIYTRNRVNGLGLVFFTFLSLLFFRLLPIFCS